MSIVCRLIGHKYTIVKRYSPAVRKLQCTRCKEYFGMNDHVSALMSWDGDLETAMRTAYPEGSEK